MKIPKEVHPALQGVVPAGIATVSASGEPNVTAISQVFWVDDSHVGLSNQFFSKTKKNILENPVALVQVIHPETCRMWFLELRFERSENSGPIFDSMSMQLDAIASMQGMQDVFRLKAADIFEVITVREATEASAS